MVSDLPTSLKMTNPPCTITITTTEPTKRSGIRLPSAITSRPATMTPMFAITSFLEKIHDARMCTPPSRCFEISRRQMRFATRATHPVPIMSRLAGSLPNTVRRMTSASTPSPNTIWSTPLTLAAVRFALPDRRTAYNAMPYTAASASMSSESARSAVDSAIHPATASARNIAPLIASSVTSVRCSRPTASSVQRHALTGRSPTPNQPCGVA